MRAAGAPLATVADYLSRFGRAPEPARRPLSPHDEAEFATILEWLAERGVRAWFEPGWRNAHRPMFEVDRLMFEGRGIGAGCMRIVGGDQLRAWRALRQDVDDSIHRRGNWSDDAASLVGSERFPCLDAGVAPRGTADGKAEG